jgi:hypothetical protein
MRRGKTRTLERTKRDALRPPILHIALLTALATAPSFAFGPSYTYVLAEGRGIDVCEHMLQVYNRRFRTPWTDEEAKGAAYEAAGSWETYYARYPSSPEFESIPWRLHRYKINAQYPYPTMAALFAELDINNDGKNELIIHLGFFKGSPGSSDSFWIFPLGVVVPDQFQTHGEFLTEVAEKRITVLNHPVHQRPFIYKGRTYIHGYEYTPRTSPGANPDEPFNPPEYLSISEYVGPDENEWMYKNMKRGAVMKRICTYEMLQHSKR